MPKLLALLSNPDNEVKLRMDRELKEINSRISPKVAHDFECIQIPAIGINELPGILWREKPDLVHFSGHGTKNKLCFEDKLGKTEDVKAEALELIFGQIDNFITCVVINACNSSGIAEKISLFVPYAIGFPTSIEDELASKFSVAFYETLSLGVDIARCFQMARAVILSNLPNKNLPVLFTNKKLSKTVGSIFKEPKITACFKLSNAGAPIKKRNMYTLTVDVKSFPATTSYIVYQVVDETFEEEDSFELVEHLGSGSSIETESYGNIILRAWLWMGEKKYGIGIEATLEEALKNYYLEVPDSLQAAYNDIVNN